MENPKVNFIATSERLPNPEIDVFVLGANGEASTGYIEEWKGKSKWLISSSNGEYFEPVFWGSIPKI